MTKEIWKNIKGYEGLYQISSFGNVKDLRRNRLRKITINRCGYCVITFSVNKIKKFFLVHRLVLLTFKPITIFMECNHRNGIKSDNKLNNLEWVTRQENQIHAFKKGLQPRKLNVKDINNIRDMYENGNFTQKEIGVKYNIARTMISRILNGTRYKDCNINDRCCP